MAERHHQLRKLAALAAPLLLAGCGALPEPGPVERPVEDVPVTDAEYRRQIMRPATDSLLVQSREQAADGRPDLAAATLERALRIDPEEPALWLELGKLAYERGDWADAEQYARRARSLAAGAPSVESRATALLADALDRQGRIAEAERLRDGG